MRAPRLAKTAQQSLVLRLDENEWRGIVCAQVPQDGRKLFQLFTFARIDQQSRPLNFTPALHVQFAECGNQRDGEIVDAVETEIFESFEDRALTRAAEPGKNHQLPGVARGSALHWVWPRPLPGADVCLECGDLPGISLQFGV